MRSDQSMDTHLAGQEYSALRATIAHRGTVRVALVPATLATWAALGTVLLAVSPLPLASLLLLMVPAAGFEAINALHVGVERIGRYLQVFYEETDTDTSVSAKWETTAMAPRLGSGQAGGLALPGGGVDPLFTLLFTTAVMLNATLAFVSGTTPVEAGVVGALHAIVLARMVRARVAAGKQRAVDLEHYRRLRDR